MMSNSQLISGITLARSSIIIFVPDSGPRKAILCLFWANLSRTQNLHILSSSLSSLDRLFQLSVYSEYSESEKYFVLMSNLSPSPNPQIGLGLNNLQLFGVGVAK